MIRKLIAASLALLTILGIASLSYATRATFAQPEIARLTLPWDLWMHQNYGNEGYALAGETFSLPAFAQLSVEGAYLYTWADSTTDIRALQRPNAADRFAACWYQNEYQFDLDLTDGAKHRVSLYMLDWDSLSRTENVIVFDPATGATLDSQIVSNFSGGVYVTWVISGHVKFLITRITGDNAVVSGLFIDPDSTPTPTPTPTPSPTPSPTPTPTPKPCPPGQRKKGAC